MAVVVIQDVDDCFKMNMEIVGRDFKKMSFNKIERQCACEQRESLLKFIKILIIKNTKIQNIIS